jgi:MSHA biogenesis protein MshJ
MNSLFSFSRIRDKFYTLSLREQLLVVAIVGVAIYFVFETLVLMPQSSRRDALVAMQASDDAQVATLNAEILAIGKSDGVLAREQIDNAQLKRQSAMLNAVLASLRVSTPPMGSLVKDVLKDYPRVTLVSLKTLKAKTLIAEPQKTIYKHGVELELRGNYLDVLAYLKNLEANTANIFWSDAQLLTLTYPEATLRVTIFVLSDQPILKIS